jgi:hypothetical protein
MACCTVQDTGGGMTDCVTASRCGEATCGGHPSCSHPHQLSDSSLTGRLLFFLLRMRVEVTPVKGVNNREDCTTVTVTKIFLHLSLQIFCALECENVFLSAL